MRRILAEVWADIRGQLVSGAVCVLVSSAALSIMACAATGRW